MLMTAMFCLLVASEANSQAMGKTEVKIGNPQYFGNPVNQATVPITMEIDSTTKGFIEIQVLVTHVRPVAANQNVPVGLTLAPPPQPGKGPVTINANFPIEKGEKYRIQTTMRFIDAMNKEGSTSDMKEIKP
jgi:hypothetical protein